MLHISKTPDESGNYNPCRSDLLIATANARRAKMPRLRHRPTASV